MPGNCFRWNTPGRIADAVAVAVAQEVEQPGVDSSGVFGTQR